MSSLHPSFRPSSRYTVLLILCGGLLGLLDAPQLTGAKNPILDWQITKSIRVWKVRKREGKRWIQSESRTARQRDRETERQREQAQTRAQRETETRVLLSTDVVDMYINHLY